MQQTYKEEADAVRLCARDRESETAPSIYILLIQLVSVSVGENLHREKCVYVCQRKQRQ